jgi:hypothetical protein
LLLSTLKERVGYRVEQTEITPVVAWVGSFVGAIRAAPLLLNTKEGKRNVEEIPAL